MDNQGSRLKKLIRERNKLAKRIAGLNHVLRGSIVSHGNICGKRICVCKRRDNPILHGPYSYLSHRSRGTINTIFLNKKKLPLAQRGVREYSEAIDLLYRLSEINFRILRYHYNKL